MTTMLARRSFLQLVAAAPIAALAPWRPPSAAFHVAFDCAVRDAYRWDQTVYMLYTRAGVRVLSEDEALAFFRVTRRHT